MQKQDYEHRNFISDVRCSLVTDSSIVLNQVKLRQTYEVLEHRILFVRNGNAKYTVNLRDYVLEEGDLLIIPKHFAVSIKQFSENFSPIVIAFLSSEAEKLRLVDFSAKHIRLSEKEQEIIKGFFQLLDRIMRVDDSTNKSMEYLILSLLWRINQIEYSRSREKENLALDRTQEILARFLDTLNIYGVEKHPINFYAERLNISPNYLSAMVKRASDKTVLYWINKKLLDTAEIMLGQRKMSVRQTAESIRFSSVSEFSRFFKKEKGFSPKDFQFPGNGHLLF